MEWDWSLGQRWSFIFNTKKVCKIVGASLRQVQLWGRIKRNNEGFGDEIREAYGF